jgi:hypothetical protein
MIVFELIEILRQFPPEMRIVVDGYEDDADDIAEVVMRHVEIDGNCKNRGEGVGLLKDYVPHDAGMGRHEFVNYSSTTKVVWLRREDYRGEDEG